MMRRRFLRREAGIGILAAIALQGFWAKVAAEDAGTVRVANTSLRLPLAPPLEGYAVTNAFPALKFDSPVAVKAPPGETNRLFVVERAGKIWVITNLTSPAKTLFLDLSAQTFSTYLESGLLGLAFHPGFAMNRQLYVYRTARTTTAGATNLIHNVLSRFEAVDPNHASPGSELRLIAQNDDSVEHNAGEVVFGPDGYLYVSFGDARPAPRDRSVDPQAIDKGFFAGIIRIDVDKRAGSLLPNAHPSSTTNYAIPPDNPFIGRTNHNGFVIDPNQVRTEFFAIGFRNPWRMAFDPLTGSLYCGDVGGASWEEIDLVERGGNYGWPHREGFAGVSPPDANDNLPLYVYGHGYKAYEGRVVIGGVVHRGNTLTELYGAYVFGDYISGNIWALRHSGTNASVERLTGEFGVSAFGIDPRDGEILLVNYDKGIIEKLVHLPSSSEPGLPQRLSDAGIFSNLSTLEPEPGFLPYELNVPFWSDNARKQRWFSIPDPAGRIGVQSNLPWTFPSGTVWIKHFGLELTNGVPESERRLETRVLVKNAEGVYGATYRWNDEQNEATLVPDEGADETFVIRDGAMERLQVWHYPSRQECLVCHTRKGGFALGFNSGQLNRDVFAGSNLVNQISWLGQLGYFDDLPDVESIRPLADATDSLYPVGYRARAYLAANCSQCHQGDQAGEGTSWDARFQTPTSVAGIVNGSLFGDFNDPLNRVISPFSPEHSMILLRLNHRGHYQMPPLASSVIDSNAVSLLTEWVLTFPPGPWQEADIGDTGQEGYASFDQGTLVVSGAGSGFNEPADDFHFLQQTLRGNAQITARLAPLTNGPPSSLAGITLRDGTATTATFALLGIRQNGEVVFLSRSKTAAGATVVGTADTLGPWLRLSYENGGVSARVSSDGRDWSLVSRDTMEFGSSINAGFAVSSGRQSRLATARFHNARVLGVTIDSTSGTSLLAPTNIPLPIILSGDVGRVDTVEFLADGVQIGATSTPPFAWVWTNAPSGQYSVSVRVKSSDSSIVNSDPIEVSVGLRRPRIRFSGEDAATRGDWTGSYGSDGYVLSAFGNQPPAYVNLALPAADTFVWTDRTLEERAARHPGSSSRFAAAWYSATNLIVDMALNDGHLHQAALYFLDWDGNDLRRQIVEVRDAASGELLDRREVSAFSGGKYLIWQVRGHVRFSVLANSAANVVLSGIFFDPSANAPPEVTLTGVSEPVLQLPGRLELVADAFDPDGRIERIDLLANGIGLARSTNAPLAYDWTNAWSGTYTLVARAVDDLGEEVTSQPLEVEALPPRANAEFLSEPEFEQGNWIGRYGLDGFVIACHVTNYPAYVSATPGNHTPYVWLEPASAPAALMKTNLVERIAACWFDPEVLHWEFGFDDGMDHKLSLYLLDYDGDGARQSNVDLLDAADGTLLDRRDVAGYAQGKYLSWKVRGRIKLRITRQTANAVLSAIFFDPLAADCPAPSLAPERSAGVDPASATLILRGQPNRLYELEVSLDLQEWYSFRSLLTPPSGEVFVPVPVAGQPARIFFRAVLPCNAGDTAGTP